MRGKIWFYVNQNEDRDPPLTSKDIQKEFNIAPNTVSEYIIDLEKWNLIRCEKIGKRKNIFPTDFSDFFFRQVLPYILFFVSNLAF